MECKCIVVGPVQTNCWIAYEKDENTRGAKDCVIIDPGDDAEKIISLIDEKNLEPAAILLTHGHFDHIGAARDIKDRYHVKIYAALEEKETLSNPAVNLSVQMTGEALTIEADEWLEDGREVDIMGQSVRCLLTPGHTVGGMSFYFPKSGALFSGDTLFAQSVGRTDFPGGSMGVLIRSIREKLFLLPDYVRVYPGHGPTTSIKDEKMLNPFAVE